MITVDQFDLRVTDLYKSQQTMSRAKLWKTGKRAGIVRVPKQELQFSRNGLRAALWDRVGLNAIPCPYGCGTVIDILSLTLDHVVPRAAGGAPSLLNMRPCCKDCNERKGQFTEEAFLQILELARTFSDYDNRVLMKRLKAASAGSPERFRRNKDAAASGAQQQQKHNRKAQSALPLEDTF
jgi:hypothetical protein